MQFRDFLRRLARTLNPDRRHPRAAKRSWGGRIECLEDRTTPTVVFNPHFLHETVSDAHGDVLHNAPIYVLFNGPGWGTTSNPSPAARGVENALTNLLNGPYLGGVHQYRPQDPDIGRLNFSPAGGAAVDSTSFPHLNLTSGFSFAALSFEVDQAIEGGLLPDVDASANQPLYLVVTAPGVQSEPGSPFTDATPSGYHAWFPDDIVPVPVPTPLGTVLVPIPTEFPKVAWVRLPVAPDGSPDMDGYTRVLSHELVEAVTDPGADIPHALFFPTPAITASGGQLGGFTHNEIADGEPDDHSYSYRLQTASGSTLVQPYWSQSDGAFIVPDGNSLRFFLDPQYTSSGKFLSSYNLTVQGDQNPADPTDHITLGTSLDGGVTVTLNGQTATFDPGTIAKIDVQPGGGSNTIDIEAIPDGVTTVTVHESGGTDTVNLSPSAHRFGDNVRGVVQISGAATTTVNAYDQNNTAAQTYMVSGAGMTDSAGHGFTIDHSAVITLSGSQGVDDYEIQTTPFGSPTTLFLGASSANTVNVGSTTARLDVNSAATGSGIDIVTIGNGNLDAVRGRVTVHGRPGGTDVFLLDQAASSASRLDYTITGTTVRRADSSLTMLFGGLDYSGLRSLTLFAEVGPNQVSVTGTAAGTPVTINANTGTATVTVGNNLDALPAPVTVHGNGTSTELDIDDRAGQAATTYSVSSSAVSRSQPGGTVSYSGVNVLALFAGGGADTVNVESTGALTQTDVTAGPHTGAVNAAPADGNLDAINSLDVECNGVADLTVNDQGGTAVPGGTTYAVDRNTLTRTATYLGVGPGLVTTHTASFTYFHLHGLTLNAGPRRNVINVAGTTAPTTVNAGPAGDAITVGNSLDNLGQLTPGAPGTFSAVGLLTVDARGGTLTLDDRGTQDNGPVQGTNVERVHTSIAFTVASAAVTRVAHVIELLDLTGPNDSLEPPPPPVVLNRFNYTATFNYHNVGALTIDGSPVGAAFTVQSTAPGTPVAVTAGTGPDRLVGPDAISVWQITGRDQGSVGNVTFASVESLVGGSGSTVLTSADTFQFFPGGQITGSIDGGGGPGANRLDYQNYPTGVAVDLTTGAATAVRGGSAGGVRAIQNLVGSRFDDTLIGDNSPNVFESPGGRDVMRGNGGDDTFRLWGPQDPGTTIDGGGGTDLFWASDFPNVWSVTGAGAGSVLGTIPGFVSGAAFSNIENLLGGGNTDTFRFAAGAGVAGYVNGGAGVNALDYSAYTTPVTVNLSAFGSWGSAMNAPQGVVSFQIVVGSRTAVNTLTGSNLAASVLVGGAGNDVLTAGTQRAVLIGGSGADVLTGGPADDLLVGGTTASDTDSVALRAVLAEWASDHSYTDRIDLIRGVATNPLFGSRANGNFFLNSATVFDDSSADQLTGGSGADWFWANPARDTTDRTGSEVLN
jgi:hypothetical protein